MWTLLIFVMSAPGGWKTIDRVTELATEADCKKAGATAAKAWKVEDNTVEFTCVKGGGW